MNKLVLQAFGSVPILVICLAALIFLPAWTLNYWQGWLFLAIFGVAALGMIAYLAVKDQKLLKRRMSGGPTAEQRIGQKIIMSISSLGFVALLVVPALDHRFGWSAVPAPLSVVADVLFVLGWLLILFVFRENSFTASTIQVVQDQKVIETGLYAIVRHPMYSGSLLYVLAMPLALGSWWGLLVVLLMLPANIWRIFDEEALLKKDLPGYTEYAQKVKYRLLPLIW